MSRSREGRMAYTFELMDIVPLTPHDSPLPRGCLTWRKRGIAQAVGDPQLENILKTEEVKHLLPKKGNIQEVEFFVMIWHEGGASKEGGKVTRTTLMFQRLWILIDLIDDMGINVEERQLGVIKVICNFKQIDAVSLVTGSCGIGLSRKVRTMERAAQEEGFIFTLYEEIKKSVAAESEEKKGKRIKRVVDSALKQKSSKKQKMMQEQESAKSDEDAAADYKHEKEELRMWLTVVPDEEETVYPKILSAKYPIVDWESQIL
ncbi:hypothetical protein Tco_1301616 [Tanacetum coccineum]